MAKATRRPVRARKPNPKGLSYALMLYAAEYIPNTPKKSKKQRKRKAASHPSKAPGSIPHRWAHCAWHACTLPAEPFWCCYAGSLHQSLVSVMFMPCSAQHVQHSSTWVAGFVAVVGESLHANAHKPRQTLPGLLLQDTRGPDRGRCCSCGAQAQAVTEATAASGSTACQGGQGEEEATATAARSRCCQVSK